MEQLNLEQRVALLEKNTQKQGVFFIIFSGDLDKIIAALNLALGSISMGQQVTFFFTFWGTTVLRKPGPQAKGKLFLQKLFGWLMPKGASKLLLSRLNFLGIGPWLLKILMKQLKKQDVAELLRIIFEHNVKVHVCSLTLDILGIKQEELIDIPNQSDECWGTAKVMETAQQSSVTLFI